MMGPNISEITVMGDSHWIFRLCSLEEATGKALRFFGKSSVQLFVQETGKGDSGFASHSQVSPQLMHHATP